MRVGPGIWQPRPLGTAMPLVQGLTLSSTSLGDTRSGGDLKKAFRGQRWSCKANLSPCAFVPSLPTRMSPISLVSHFCLPPGSFSSCWKHTQVSSLLHKALLDLTLSPISCTAHSLNMHNPMGSIFFSQRPVDRAPASALSGHRQQNDPV